MIYLSLFGILAFIFALVAYVQVSQLKGEITILRREIQRGEPSS